MRGGKLFHLMLLIAFIGSSNNLMAQKEAKDQEWKSISVLHTTRSEVEKLFGKHADINEYNKFQRLYKQKDYNLIIYYSKGCTDGAKGDYNVPPETVTYLIVALKKGMPLSAFNIDPTKFEKTVFPDSIYLSDTSQGVVYRLTNDESTVFTINYSPRKEDYKLSCAK